MPIPGVSAGRSGLVARQIEDERKARRQAATQNLAMGIASLGMQGVNTGIDVWQRGKAREQQQQQFDVEAKLAGERNRIAAKQARANLEDIKLRREMSSPGYKAKQAILENEIAKMGSVFNEGQFPPGTYESVAEQTMVHGQVPPWVANERALQEAVKSAKASSPLGAGEMMDYSKLTASPEAAVKAEAYLSKFVPESQRTVIREALLRRLGGSAVPLSQTPESFRSLPAPTRRQSGLFDPILPQPEIPRDAPYNPNPWSDERRAIANEAFVEKKLLQDLWVQMLRESGRPGYVPGEVDRDVYEPQVTPEQLEELRSRLSLRDLMGY